jgi:endonuclease YncB( thermonuclease family)
MRILPNRILLVVAMSAGLGTVAACSLPLAPAQTATPTRTPALLSIPLAPIEGTPTVVEAPTKPTTSPDLPGTPVPPFATLAPAATPSALATVTTPPTPSPAPTLALPTRPIGLPQARVAYVVDGDTIDVVLDGSTVRVRLIGVDTPEIVDPNRPRQCYSAEASARTRALVENKVVWLEADLSQGDKDTFGRLLRYVWLPDGPLLNLSLIQDGYGVELSVGAGYKHQSVFLQAQQAARVAQRGLWSPTACGGNVPFLTATPGSTATPNTPVVTPSRPVSTPTAGPNLPPTREPFSTGAATRVPPTSSGALEIVSVTSPVSPGGTAQVVAQTLPSAPCSLKVLYKSPVAEEQSIGFKTAESDGRVVWRWTVPSDAPLGIGTVTVTCAGFSRAASMTVR